MPRGASIWKLRMAFSWVLMEPPSIWMAVDGTFHSSSSRDIQRDSGVLPIPPSGFLPPVQKISGAFPERYSRKATNRRSLGSISPVKWCRRCVGFALNNAKNNAKWRSEALFGCLASKHFC